MVRRLAYRYDAKRHSERGHLRALFAIHDVGDMIRLDTPWWAYGAIGLVEDHLRRSDGRARAFEYGLGASSLWLAARSGEVHIVEHHAGFAGVMRDLLARSGLGDKVTLHEVPAEAVDTPITRSGRRGEDGVNYTNYAQSIEIPGGLFDLVVVDGRARVACMEVALSHLASGWPLRFRRRATPSVPRRYSVEWASRPGDLGLGPVAAIPASDRRPRPVGAPLSRAQRSCSSSPNR